MPFDAAELDRTTLLLLKLRDRLTAENWRPYASNRTAFKEGRGCLVQQLAHVAERRVTSREYRAALRRLTDALGVYYADDIGTFNDTHSLEEVQAVVDKAIARE